jgi:hypothetical protein
MRGILARVFRILGWASFLSVLTLLGLIALEGNRSLAASYRAVFEIDPIQAAFGFLTCLVVGLLLDFYVHSEI